MVGWLFGQLGVSWLVNGCIGWFGWWVGGLVWSGGHSG